MRVSKRQNTTFAFLVVIALFFTGGFVTCAVNQLAPIAKSVFSLSYSNAMLTQFAFFIAYFFFSMPAAFLVAHQGYARAMLIALGGIVFGNLIIPVATATQAYPVLLLAVFVIASGITILQVAVNPLVAGLGTPEQSHFRLNLAQAFNSLATMVVPFVASQFILNGGVFGAAGSSEAARVETLHSINIAALSMAVVVAALGAFMWTIHGEIAAAAPPTEEEPTSPWLALRSKWAVFGACCIFMYVGAEVYIGGILVNFLQEPTVLSASAERAAELVSLYWGGAMVGRFLGSAALSRCKAPPLLAGVAVVAVLLCLTVSLTTGTVAAVTAVAIGLCNSIMFPTIFTLTLERSTATAPATSGLVNVFIVGAAIMPFVAGLVADIHGIAAAFLVPLTSYAFIAFFAVAAGRSVPKALSGSAH